MTIQDLGSVGEVVGAIATVGTLLYLAVQIRANTKATRAEARRNSVGTETTSYSSIVEHADVAALFQQGLADPKSLNPGERVRFEFLLAPFVAHSQLEYLEHQEGLRDVGTFDRNMGARLMFLRSPGGAAFWGRRRDYYDAGFQDYVDNFLARE